MNMDEQWKQLYGLWATSAGCSAGGWSHRWIDSSSCSVATLAQGEEEDMDERGQTRSSSCSRSSSVASLAQVEEDVLYAWREGRFSGALVSSLRRAMLEAEGSTTEEVLESFVADKLCDEFFSTEEEFDALFPLLLRLAQERA